MEIGRKYKTNYTQILELIETNRDSYIFKNQFNEKVTFNNRLEPISMLGSLLRIVGD